MAFTRRHLPHWIPEGTDIFVTWRLAGSLPTHAEIPSAEQGGRIPCLRPEEQLDRARCGPVWLQDSRIACVVANALLYGEAVRRFYQLHAWVIMPNHVHAIFQPRIAMPTIMRWLKGRTSRVANRLLGRTGTTFWQDESFDHWVRSAQELQDLIEYVENNPVKAGLVGVKEQWRWSSAGWVTGDASGTGDTGVKGEARVTDDASDRLSYSPSRRH
jgi:REP element-mobilizing transposase RayT